MRALFCVSVIAILSCSQATTASLPQTVRSDFTKKYECEASLKFCNISVPLDERIEDLLFQLSMAEKINMLGHKQKEIPRLGINNYTWWNEGLHGLAYSEGYTFQGTLKSSTQFPQVSLSAASFDEDLWRLIGQFIAGEARVFYNAQEGGADIWAPNVNLVRDPRWGRAQETPGEDVLLTSSYLREYIAGAQIPSPPPPPMSSVSSDDSTVEEPRLRLNERETIPFYQLIPTCKHLTAYDLEGWKNVTDRYHFDARPSTQDLHDYFNQPFQACQDSVESWPIQQYMCSYNSLDGTPSCANPYLLSTLLRDHWGFNGFVVSDCSAISQEKWGHGWAPDGPTAVAKSLKAGCDVNCGDWYQIFTVDALSRNLITQKDINDALRRQFRVRMLMGDFLPRDDTPFLSYSRKNRWGLPAAKRVAKKAALGGCVLLKNDKSTMAPFNPILPLKQHHQLEELHSEASSVPSALSRGPSHAVIGPFYNGTNYLLGNYYGEASFISGVDTAWSSAFPNDALITSPVCEDAIDCNSLDEKFIERLFADHSLTTVVLCVGLSYDLEREGKDLPTLLLPEGQMKLIHRIGKHLADINTINRGTDSNPSREVKGILLLFTGKGIDITMIEFVEAFQAVVWTGYPGEKGGEAIVDLLIGKEDFSGRLPTTWYENKYVDQVDMRDMRMRPGDKNQHFLGRTYKWFSFPRDVLYPFGFGLSYHYYTVDLREAGEGVWRAGTESVKQWQPIEGHVVTVGPEDCRTIREEHTFAPVPSSSEISESASFSASALSPAPALSACSKSRVYRGQKGIWIRLMVNTTAMPSRHSILAFGHRVTTWNETLFGYPPITDLLGFTKTKGIANEEELSIFIGYNSLTVTAKDGNVYWVPGVIRVSVGGGHAYSSIVSRVSASTSSSSMNGEKLRTWMDVYRGESFDLVLKGRERRVAVRPAPPPTENSQEHQQRHQTSHQHRSSSLRRSGHEKDDDSQLKFKFVES